MKNFLPIDFPQTRMKEDKEGRSPNHPGDLPASEPERLRWGSETGAPCKGKPPERGWILYDGQCRYCIAAAERFERLFAGRGFEFVPLQTPWVQKRLGLDPHTRLEEMRVLTVAGEDFSGADAVIFLMKQAWWARPFYLLAQLPGLHAIIDRAYRWIAAHRGCTHLGCATRIGRDDLVSSHYSRDETSSSLPARVIPWTGLAILPAAALLTRSHIAPWIFMWLMAGAIFLGCKWLTFCRAIQTQVHPRPGRSFGYFFLWPGMDATGFLGSGINDRTAARRTRKIIFPLIKIAFGLLALFFLARLAPNHLLAGWIGMIGLIFILHFGLFDLAAIAWRVAGVDAKPIMNAPIKSKSLNEFWGRRWNGAFNQLILDIFFRPLARSVGTVRGTLTAFLISGLLHELVISLPAGAGYGLPTAYFLLQGWGVVAQRSSFGKRFQLRQGSRGWIFTMLLTAGPVFWLFHPPFVERVIVPFMQTIGAL